MTEAFSVRIKRLMRAMGWPKKYMALRLGMRAEAAVTRLVNGGRPTVAVVLRLQELEAEYAGTLEVQKRVPWRTVGRTHLWPPVWVGCRKRWWVVRHGAIEPTTRPADLAALAGDRTRPEVALTGRHDPRNFPGRTLRAVDWTAAGRAKYAADLREQLGRPKVVKRIVPGDFERSAEGKQ